MIQRLGGSCCRKLPVNMKQVRDIDVSVGVLASKYSENEKLFPRIHSVKLVFNNFLKIYGEHVERHFYFKLYPKNPNIRVVKLNCFLLELIATDLISTCPPSEFHWSLC